MTAPSPASDEGSAVSPIVGVILMVAITVVVAGVLFIIVQGIGMGDEPAPIVQFLRSNKDGQLEVIRLNKEIDLTAVEIKISSDGHFAYNEDATPSSASAPQGQYVAVSDTPGALLKAGDFLEFCLDGPPGTVEVWVRITSPPDVVIYENSLTGLRSC